ncbi:hypothetical protein Tco_0684702 [Tanacetum coccineum]
MIAPSSSRYSSNDMVHNHYLEEAKKKTQEIGRNSKPSVIPYARSQSTYNNSKPKPRSNTQTSRNWPKCVYNANHDTCVTKFLNEVNSRAKIPSNKTTNRNKPVKQTSFTKKPERQITKGHRWVPTGKIFTSSTTKVDSEPTNGSNEDITNQYECEQTLDVSAGTLNLSAVMTSDHNSPELGIHDHSNEPSSLKLVPKVVPPADKKATSQQELELLFSPMYEEYFNARNLSVSKSSTQHDTQPTLNAPPTSEPINPPTNVNA